VRGDEQAKEVHEATRAAAKERLAAAKRLSDYRKRVAKQVEKDLDELMGALRADGG
jgi:DNA repair ATPase RecN